MNDVACSKPAGATARLRRIQRSSLAFLVLAGTLNYFDRSALAIANPLIRAELGLSLAQMGLLLSMFLWTYALAQLPGGILADRLGARRLLGGALGLWSVAQAAAGLVSNLTQFSIARAMLGLGEAPMFPCAVSVTRSWFPVHRRAAVTGAWNCVSTLGPTLAPPVLTAMMLAYGWRVMFLILGGIGVAIAGAWFAVYRDRATSDLTPRERYALGEDTQAMPVKPTLAEWRALFGFRATWGLGLGYFGIIYLLWLFAAWLPAYLEMQRHMGVGSTGWVAAIPFSFGVVGSLGSGWLGDLLLKVGHSPIGTRKAMVVVALLGMAVCTFATACADSDLWAVAGIAGALFWNGCATTVTWSLVGEVAPRGHTASLAGITNFGGYLGGALAPLATGFLIQHSGNFAFALVLAAGLAVISAVAFVWLVPNRPIALVRAAEEAALAGPSILS